MKKLLTFIFLATIVLSGFAQNEQFFSLQECIGYSLQNHASVEVSKNNLKISEEGKKQAVGLYLPQVQGVASATDNLKLQTNVLSTDIEGMEEMEIQFGQKYSNNVYVDVTQTIYDQSKIFNIKATNEQLKIADFKDQQNDEQLIYNTAQAYFQVLICDASVEQLNENLVIYNQLADILKLQLDKGVAIETDYQRIEVNRQSVEYQLDEMKTQRINALNNLKFAMGFPLDKPLNVSESTDFESYVKFPVLPDWSVDSLTDYSINKVNVELQGINTKLTRSASLPKINAVARVGSQSMNGEFSGAFDNWHDYSYVGLSLNVPLFTGLRNSSKSRQERLNYENAVTNLQLFEQKYDLAFQNAQKSLLTSYNSLQRNEDNLELAQKLYSSTKLSYQKGAAPLTDFLNDDNAYKNAQSNYINSLYSYMIARLDFEKAKGTLFSFYNQLGNN
ncbi:hypothetical protein GM418_14250 [Maribellus comscasis]|uniref:TolC family protein n=1 Tax=Maribellus comscasis TaxID=2681766 RepID=A0A6I6JUP9_9BACT|nr:TolC family protein [Maribellus comscasis]QGY44788.1 hypothetical protein GM418_14250 [Maribellus comscasis]